MPPKTEERRLGRGLAALFGDMPPPAPPGQGAELRRVPIDMLDANPFQPRTHIQEADLEELAASMRSHGVLQPLLVRPHPNFPERFFIVAGERRWRAAALAGLHEVPVVVQSFSDADAAAAALIENLQRQDLNVMEEAEGYRRLIDEFRLTHETLANALGKSRAHITNLLRLLHLPEATQGAVRDGRITFAHAKALLGHPDPDSVLPQITGRHLNVRQTEDLVAQSRQKPETGKRQSQHESNADVEAIARELTEHLGFAVAISMAGRGGTIRIGFRTQDQMEALIDRLRRA